MVDIPFGDGLVFTPINYPIYLSLWNLDYIHYINITFLWGHYWKLSTWENKFDQGIAEINIIIRSLSP